MKLKQNAEPAEQHAESMHYVCHSPQFPGAVFSCFLCMFDSIALLILCVYTDYRCIGLARKQTYRNRQNAHMLALASLASLVV